MKTTRHIIAEYVQRKDLLGLADYFNAYLDDECMEYISQNSQKTDISGEHITQSDMTTFIENKVAEFEDRYRDISSAIKSYGEYCDVRDFLTTALQEAWEAGMTRGLKYGWTEGEKARYELGLAEGYKKGFIDGGIKQD